MDFRTIGSSGLEVSTLGLGCNNFGGRLDKAGSEAVIKAALDLGITHFDTADVYPMGQFGMSETIIGEALGTARKDVVLATKFGYPTGEGGRRPGGSRRYIIAAVEESLQRLQTDWIDLLYYHKPDPRTPREESVRALDDLIRSGKVRYVACSNFPAWQMVDALWIARELGVNSFIGAQDEYSLLTRGVETDLVPALNATGMGLVPFFPLASGLLTGKYRKGAPMPEGTRLTKAKPLADMFMTDANMDKVEALAQFADRRDMALTDIAFSWLLAQKPVASVIAGASSRAQLEANLKAVEHKLTSDDLAEIDRITAG